MVEIRLSEADAKALLALLKTSETFPDVVESLQDALAARK
jgi:hypothetical protein